MKQIQIRPKLRQIAKLQRTKGVFNFMFGEKDDPTWTFSNVLLMLLTARAPQAVLKQKKRESVCKVN